MSPRRAFFTLCLLFFCGVSALAQVTVSVQQPANNSKGSSPMLVQASASEAGGSVTSMHILVDGTEVFFQWGNSVKAYLWLSRGWHTVVVQGTDDSAKISGNQTLTLYSRSGSGTVANIDSWDPWQNCTDYTCAGGNGNKPGANTTVVAWSAPFQTSPALDGSSRQFYLGGSGSYGNAYWYKFIGGSSTASNYTYDLWVRVSDPTAPQALEFDVNHSFSNQRWVFGTECNLKQTQSWRVWDASTGWVNTGVSCTPATFPANTWVHLVWSVYRHGRNVVYRSVSINGTQRNLGIQLNNQQNWTGADIDVTLQMDGDSQQTPYYVWLDKVNLTAN